MTTTAIWKQKLRTQLRARRKQLSAAEQRQAARNLCRVVTSQKVWKQSQHIAVYIANDHEIDPWPLVEMGWQQNKQIYVPVLNPDQSGSLLFLPWQADTVLHPNRFGIAEPCLTTSDVLPPDKLDLILMPLTGFDARGRRLGMGGGFYDRTLAPLVKTSTGKPWLVGLAHACQQMSELPEERWDIQVSAIYTDLQAFVINKWMNCLGRTDCLQRDLFVD